MATDFSRLSRTSSLGNNHKLRKQLTIHRSLMRLETMKQKLRDSMMRKESNLLKEIEREEGKEQY
jgi:hypothetical protein